MGFKSDIEIAQEATPRHISEIARKLGLTEDDIEYYGKYKAKVDYNLLSQGNPNHKAKLILVTAINPTPAGEGKTTTTIGVGDALDGEVRRRHVVVNDVAVFFKDRNVDVARADA